MSMQDYFGPYQLTQAGNPQLISDDEVILQHESDLSIYFGDEKKYRKGKSVLTTHRVLWTDSKSERHSLHLKHVKSTSTKSGIMGVSSPKIIVYLNDREVVQRPTGAHANLQQPKLIKVAPPNPGYIKLSFHTSSDRRDQFVPKLNKAVDSKAWHKQNEEEKRDFTTKAAGNRGLMAENQRKQQQQSKVVNEAELEEKEEEINIDESEWTQYRNMFIKAGFTGKDVPKNLTQCKDQPDYQMWESIISLVQKKTNSNPTSIKTQNDLKKLCDTDGQRQFIDRGGRGDTQEVTDDDFSKYRNMLTTMKLDRSKVPKDRKGCDETLLEILSFIDQPQKIRKVEDCKKVLQKKAPADKFDVYCEYIDGMKK